MLKTASSGYDGKGQRMITHIADAPAAWEAIGQAPAILEGFVDFARELSVVAARGMDGRFAHYGLMANTHRHHILDVSVAPVDMPASVAAAATSYTRIVMEQLDAVGVLCVEFFLTKEGRLLLNEIAPRPHNSGHLTVDACVTGQFEQQLRAICGLPLGDTRYLQAAAMVNLLGDLWQDGAPDWARLLALPHVKLHLYGKRDARPGRKMGHLTALADTPAAAAQLARAAWRVASGEG
ncbi:MAG: ATP-grasp domain-containing protein [Anaerolineales bacterium]|nr:ATP-grasp domain-containing protein [Anaerolineales bacterium]